MLSQLDLQEAWDGYDEALLVVGLHSLQTEFRSLGIDFHLTQKLLLKVICLNSPIILSRRELAGFGAVCTGGTRGNTGVEAVIYVNQCICFLYAFVSGCVYWSQSVERFTTQ